MLVNKLNGIRSSKTDEEGFTLIELMIVVVIIGILAAIAIPIFANQQQAAIEAKVKSDVKNSVTEAGTFLINHPTASSLDGVTVVASEGTTISSTGGWDTYVIQGTNVAVPDFKWCFSAATGKSGTVVCEGTTGVDNGGGTVIGGDTLTAEMRQSVEEVVTAKYQENIIAMNNGETFSEDNVQIGTTPDGTPIIASFTVYQPHPTYGGNAGTKIYGWVDGLNDNGSGEAYYATTAYEYSSDGEYYWASGGGW